MGRSTIDLIGYCPTNGWGDGETMAGEACCDGEACQPWRRANKRDMVETFGFQATPGAGYLLFGHYWQQFASCCPAGLDIRLPHGVGASIRSYIPQPATADQE